jgi:hypothetical protein
VGETFNDPAAGITITVTGPTSTQAKLQMTLTR